MTDKTKNALGTAWATAIIVFGLATWPLHSWQPAAAYAQWLAIGGALVATFWIVNHNRATR
jgi:hypothetical protein